MAPITKLSSNILGFEPNWAGGVELDYAFSTVVSQARLKSEQRKALTARPLRVQRCEFLLQEGEYAQLLNWMRYYGSAYMLVPIYVEPIVSTDTVDLQGLSIINTENTQYFKNLHAYQGGAVIVDVRNTTKVEQLDVNVVSNTSITLSTPIAGSFPGGSSNVYSIMRAYINERDFRHLSEGLTVASVTFQEILNEDPIVGIGAS